LVFFCREIGYALGLADTAASSQAAEMLERLANLTLRK
jgi:hypothetical protein